MNDDLQKQVFEYIKETAEKIGDFAAKEVPPFITEFLNWKFWEAGAYVGVWSVIVLLFFAIWGTWFVKRKNDIFDDFDGEGFAFLISGGGCFLFAVFLPFIMCIFGKIMTMVQISIAPKVFLIEYAANYLK